MSEVPRLEFECGGRFLTEIVGGLPPPFLHCRARRHTFETDTMERTDADEIIVGMPRHPQMADL